MTPTVLGAAQRSRHQYVIGRSCASGAAVRTLTAMSPTTPSAFFSRIVDNVLDRIDASPLTPQGLARRRIDALHEERGRRAAGDPRWQEIQGRRGPGGLTMISPDVSWADWEEQRRIEKELLPDPWWLPAMQRVSQLSVRSAQRNVRTVTQRATRGWADRDVWSLDRHLCRTLAAQLQHLADKGNAWPGDTARWADEHEWQADLRRNAALLRRYADAWGSEAATHDWYERSTSRDVDPETVEAYSEAIHSAEKRELEGAKQALRWVADHLELLWD
jgi:hypothetical protein